MQAVKWRDYTVTKKNILVTGATRGLGLSIVKQLYQSGYQVIASGRTLSQELSDFINTASGHVSFMPLDLNNVNDIHAFIKTIDKKHGYLYGLVNNAAIGHDGVLATLHESQITELLTVNLQAAIYLAKYSSRSMLLNQKGRIINISSIVAKTGFKGLSVYAATKSAMEGFSKSLARELGGANITVNCIAPGFMETDMTQMLQGKKLDSILRRSPLNKLVTTDDVAQSVVYLMSDSADTITGTTLTIDAGSTA